MFPWEREVPRLHEAFAAAGPFPHVVIDGFTDPEWLRAIACEDFADVGTARWTFHRYYSQKTYSRTDLGTFGPAAHRLLAAVAAAPFRRLVSDITGIENLLFDDELEDGGLQATAAGGYLFLHVDPLVHPRRRRWRRRVNLLVYLNETWNPDCGGELELWDAHVSACGARVAPLFNRAVLFAAGPDTPHGFPDPLRCPPGVSRNCLAVYYFAEELEEPAPHFGRLFARPGERVARLGVAFDNLAVHVYGRLGQTLGIDDRLINRLVRPFRRKA
jgi:hypothetical protein